MIWSGDEAFKRLETRALTAIKIKLNGMMGGSGEHKCGTKHLRKAKNIKTNKSHTFDQNYVYNNGTSIIIVPFVFVCCRFI